MKNQMKRIGKAGLLFAEVSLLCLMVGCSGGVKKESDGGVTVSDGEGSCTVYIIEKDGYKFAVALGYSKCAITQRKE